MGISGRPTGLWCPECHIQLIRRGFSRSGEQAYQCKECRTISTEARFATAIAEKKMRSFKAERLGHISEAPPAEDVLEEWDAPTEPDWVEVIPVPVEQCYMCGIKQANSQHIGICHGCAGKLTRARAEARKLPMHVKRALARRAVRGLEENGFVSVGLFQWDPYLENKRLEERYEYHHG